LLSEETVDIEKKLVSRRLLIVGVGSSAITKVISGIANVTPQILFENEFVLVETSKDSLKVAIETLTATYQDLCARKAGVGREKFRGFPTTIFKHKLIQNSVLISTLGGATMPEYGLKSYSEKRSSTLQKIVDVYYKEGEECSGIVVIGCSGKGTATLVAPSIINDIYDRTDLPHPLGFITLPFRFNRTFITNAGSTIEFIINNSVPCFLLDYEHALDMYLYLHGEKLKRPTLKKVYSSVIIALARVLSTLIEALNYGQDCSPPIDWSDLLPIFEMTGKVGTLAYSYRTREDDFDKHWREDLSQLLLLRNKSKPSSTYVLSIMRSGAGIPIDIAEKISEYYAKEWNAVRHDDYTLERGAGYTIASLIYGFDPREIYPEVKYKGYKLLDRIKRGILG